MLRFENIFLCWFVETTIPLNHRKTLLLCITPFQIIHPPPLLLLRLIELYNFNFFSDKVYGAKSVIDYHYLSIDQFLQPQIKGKIGKKRLLEISFQFLTHHERQNRNGRRKREIERERERERESIEKKGLFVECSKFWYYP